MYRETRRLRPLCCDQQPFEPFDEIYPPLLVRCNISLAPMMSFHLPDTGRTPGHFLPNFAHFQALNGLIRAHDRRKVSKNPPKWPISSHGAIGGMTSPAGQFHTGSLNIRKMSHFGMAWANVPAGNNSNLPFFSIGVECANCMAFNRQ